MPKRRLVALPWGEEKTGKTHFAFTFPAPIYLYDFNFGTEGVIEEFEEKVAMYYPYPLLPCPSVEEMEQTLNKFRREYREGIRDAPAGATIIIDNCTDLDVIVTEVMKKETFEHKYHNEIKGKAADLEDYQPPPLDWGRRNAYMRSILTSPLTRRDLNAVMIHAAKPVFADNKKTGRWELAGYGGASKATQVTIQTQRKGMEFS